MESKLINPKIFTLIRLNDETGISGTGRILDGVIFHTGQVVVCWRSDLRTDKPGNSSISIYDTWEAFKSIHIDPHPSINTKIIFAEELQFIND